MVKEVKMIITLPKELHTKLKVKSAKTSKSMHSIIIESLKDSLK